jgi:chromosome segregation ATPase
MNEESTKELSNKRSFEDRVFARFDLIDRRFDGVETRLEKLETKSYDTKPIWERALKEVHETRLEVGEIKTRVDGLDTKVDGLAISVGNLESEVTGLRTDYGGLHDELVQSQRDFKVKLYRRIDLVLKVLADNRDDMRNSDERLTRLESKLA